MAAGLFCENKSSEEGAWREELRQHAVRMFKGKTRTPYSGPMVSISPGGRVLANTQNLTPPMYARKRAQHANGGSVPKLSAQGNNPIHENGH